MIGSAGSEEKIKWLKSLGFDHVFNYKTEKDLGKRLKEWAPEGIDVYFDNVSISIPCLARFLEQK